MFVKPSNIGCTCSVNVSLLSMARLSRREGADCSVSHEGSSISLTDNFSRTIPRSEGKVLPSGLSGVAGCLFPHAVVR